MKLMHGRRIMDFFQEEILWLEASMNGIVTTKQHSTRIMEYLGWGWY